MTKRSIVYVDGLNLYYGALRGGPHKWLDLERYFELLRPHDELEIIRWNELGAPFLNRRSAGRWFPMVLADPGGCRLCEINTESNFWPVDSGKRQA